jgi:bla regulator protein BlaR1
LLAATGMIAAGLSFAFGQGSAGQQAQITAAVDPSAQSIGMPDWQKAAGEKMSFEVASVRPTGPKNSIRSNTPLGPDNSFAPTGGLFLAARPVSAYIEFAYKLFLTNNQRDAMLKHLPGWIRTEDFTVEARGPVNATKDQMRLMMQSLLADRFGLKVHFEARETPVSVMTLVHSDRLGPKLHPHSEGVPCDQVIPLPSPDTEINVWPLSCDDYALHFDGRHPALLGSRNTTLDLMALSLSEWAEGELGRPIVNRTGLTGRYDFTLMWALNPGGSLPPDSDALQAPTLLEAMKEQLGMRLEPAKLPLQVLVVDQVERPSEN